MAIFLYRLGNTAFRRRPVVLLVWLALLGAAIIAALSAPATKALPFTLPGAESQKAFDLLDQRFPGSASDGATARIVFKAPEGQTMTTAANKAEVQKVTEEIASGSDQVASAVDPYTAGAISKDGSTAYISVTYKVTAAEVGSDSHDALDKTVEQARESGLTVEAGGNAVKVASHGAAAEVIGVIVAAIVLVITFGSLVAAGLSLLTALIGVGIGFLTLTALNSPLELGDNAGVLALMLGLAVGIDYALFIVSRYRSELAEGHPKQEAAARATGTAGSAVVFAGLTVIIALAGLAVVNIPMLTKMGLAAAGSVTIAVIIAVTLVPAMLGFAGDRVLSKTGKNKAGKNKVAKSRAGRNKAGENEAGKNEEEPAAADSTAKVPMGLRWAQFVLRRPAAVLLAGVVGLGVIAIPSASMTLGLPDDGAQPSDTTQRRAYDLLSEGFGVGFNGPLVVVVDAAGSDDPKTVASEVVSRISKLDDVAAVAPARFNQTGNTAIVTTIPSSKPASEATEKLVERIRDTGTAIEKDTGARLLVTGQTAVNVDFSQKVNDSLIPYLALVVGLAFLLLMAVFRSVLVPLKAALGFLLSVLAALGAVVAVFQWGWLASAIGVEDTGPIMSLMPIFMVGIVFGLAMDYEVFLVTRMREAYVHGEGPAQAVLTGFRDGGRVVTAAAVIMIAVFSGFIGASGAMIKTIGFGLAVAVLFDAFVVRMAIVPAVLALLGKSAWWLPTWLDKILPNVDVEGEKLAKSPAPEPGSGPGADDHPQPVRV
ncbi:membrane transport protein [Streptomyces bingchenggensis BCW-1]|uniref:Membrane transport protein n=1 Tax=Streptomyces bingchenggensis (strain BCW-1) TaxID=749414 RepID=D7C7D4_STRBB|nr:MULTISPECIES: MMPL family transporter [Streptomyces]ADI10488.1 membrane transport protein [Streptomyces bingchenggensis BCW-1]